MRAVGKAVIVRLAVTACCLVALAGCGGRRAADPPEKVTLAVSTLPHASLVHIAAAKGYFNKEALEVTMQPYQFGKLALDALLAGRADLATCAETPIVFAVLNRQEVSVLATIAGGTTGEAVVALKSAGISTARDLAGKRIGVARGTSGEFFLDTLLIRHGVDREAVRLVDMRPEDMPGALAKGEVDAVSIWIPIISDLQKLLGDKALTFYAEDIFSETFNVVTRKGFVARRPAAAGRFLLALLRAEAFIREQPEKARRTAAASLGQDPAQVDALFGQFDFRVRLDQSLVVLMEEEARWAIGRGLVPRQGTPNFLNAIDSEPLLAVRPSAVQLVR